jgi:hypothetical protein
MGLDDEGRGNPHLAHVRFKQLRRKNGLTLPCSGEPGLHAFYTHEKDNRKEPVNKGVSILKTKKKSNKQSSAQRIIRGKRETLLTL